MQIQLKATRALARGMCCAFVTALVLGTGGAAMADAIVSGVDDATCELVGAADSCSLEEITPRRRWKHNNPQGRGARWVSSSESASSDSLFASFGDFQDGTTAPASRLSVFETFSVGLQGGILSLSVWADGPASVWLDGVNLVALDRSSGKRHHLARGRGQLAARARSSRCGGGAFGCPGSQRQDFLEEVGGGLHELRVEVEQGGRARSSVRLGVLYSGTSADNFAAAPIPEPSAALLFASGSAIVGLGIRRCRRCRKAEAGERA